MQHLELPHDEQAERAILSSIMLDNDCMFDINLRWNDFYTAQNRYLFDAMSKLHKQGSKIDFVTITSYLNSHWITIQSDYIAEIACRLMTASGFEDYARNVKDLSVKRQLIAHSQALIASCYSSKSSNDILSTALNWLNIDDVRQDEEDYFEQALSSYGKWSTAIASYWYTPLDQITSWIHPWRLIIVWAWTHVGKTLFSTFATQQISTLWTPVGYITYEMKWSEIADRILSSAFKLGKDRYFRGREDMNIDNKILDKLKQNVSIFFRCKTIDDIILNIKRSHAKKWTRIFFIDHLWLILSNKNDTKNNLIWEYTSKLKNLSMELDIAIIALSQLNRWDSKENKPPSLSSLRDSWNIEQDADVVILLHREKDDEGKMMWSIKMRVLKNRVNGEMNECVAEIDNDNFRLS